MAIVMAVTCTKAKNIEQPGHGLSNSECLYIFFFFLHLWDLFVLRLGESREGNIFVFFSC